MRNALRHSPPIFPVCVLFALFCVRAEARLIPVCVTPFTISGGSLLSIEERYCYLRDDGRGWGGGSSGQRGEAGGGNGDFVPNPGENVSVRDASEKTPCEQSGNPIVLSTGNKIEPEADFASSGEMPLSLVRTYNAYWNYIGLFGKFWVSSFDYSLVWSGTNDALIYAQRPDGRRIKFIRVGTTDRWNEDKPQPVAYVLKNGDGTYTLHSEDVADQPLETYDAAGRPLTVRNLQGIGWTYAYGSGNLANYPVRITHTSGRYVALGWTIPAGAGSTGGGYLSSVTAPDGSVFNYTYALDAFGANVHRLASATAPSVTGGNDSTRVDYHYENASRPGALTGKSYQ